MSSSQLILLTTLLQKNQDLFQTTFPMLLTSKQVALIKLCLIKEVRVKSVKKTSARDTDSKKLKIDHTVAKRKLSTRSVVPKKQLKIDNFVATNIEKNMLKSKQCSQCDFEAFDQGDLDAHMKKGHEPNSVSTSQSPVRISLINNKNCNGNTSKKASSKPNADENAPKPSSRAISQFYLLLFFTLLKMKTTSMTAP